MKQIYKNGDRFVVRNLIRPDFSDPAESEGSNTDRLKAMLDGMVNPDRILKGLQRELAGARKSAKGDPDLLKRLDEFEDDLTITVAAAARGEYSFVAFKMFNLGRLLERLNMLPVMASALSNEYRKEASGRSTEEKFRGFQEMAEELVANCSVPFLKKRGTQAHLAKELRNQLSSPATWAEAGLIQEPSERACIARIKKATERRIKNEGASPF